MGQKPRKAPRVEADCSEKSNEVPLTSNKQGQNKLDKVTSENESSKGRKTILISNLISERHYIDSVKDN
jgi:hypothetical protein